MKKQVTVQDFRDAGLPNKREGKPVVRAECEAVLDEVEQFGVRFSSLLTTAGNRKHKAALKAVQALRAELSVAKWGR